MAHRITLSDRTLKAGENATFIVDTVAPTVTSIGNLPAIVPAGSRIVTVTFSEPVTGITTSSLDVTNATGRVWSADSTDGGRTWNFEWIPYPGSRGNKTISVNLAGIQDKAGNAAVDSPGRTKTFELDALRFNLDNLNIADNHLTAGETTTFTFTFNRVVIGFDSSKVKFTGNTGQLGPLVPQPGAEGRVWTATFTPTANLDRTAGSIYVDYSGMTDQANNTIHGITMPYRYTVDTRRPSVSAASIGDHHLKAGEETTITFSFSEALDRSSFTTADLRVGNGKGTLSDLRTTDGITWTVKLKAPASLPAGSNGVSNGNRVEINMAGITDLAGNAGAGGWSNLGISGSTDYAIDLVAPTITAINVPTAPIRAGQDAAITITFSEPVTGLTSTNIHLANANGSLVRAPSSTDGGSTWTFTFRPTANIDDRSNTISVSLAGIKDRAGNAAAEGTHRTSGNFSIDTVAPTVSVTMDDYRLTANETTTVTFTFNERVAGFDKGDVVLSGTTGVLGKLTPQGTDGRVWKASFTPTANLAGTTGRIAVKMNGITDAAGNTGKGQTLGNNYTVDTKVFAIRDAVVYDKRLVLRYSDETRLDENPHHRAPNDAFTVLADGKRISVRDVSVDATGKTVTLKLASTVAGGQPVTVAYTDPTAGDDIRAVQEATTATGDRNNDAASFKARPVTNLTPATVPRSSPAATDSDRDGLSNAREDQAPGLLRPDGSAGLAGDGNGDGIEDSQQAAVSSTSDLTLVAGSRDGKPIDDSNNARITQLERKEAPANLPKGMEMPIGLTQFTVALADGRSTESFSLYVDPATGANGYWVQDDTGTWVNLASEPYGGKMVNEGGRLRLDFQIRDGGPHDADGQENGSVTTIPGAAAKMALSIVGQPHVVEPHGFWL